MAKVVDSFRACWDHPALFWATSSGGSSIWLGVKAPDPVLAIGKGALPHLRPSTAACQSQTGGVPRTLWE